MDDREQQEQAMRTLFDEGAFENVATRALNAYGPELLGFLEARLPSASDADETFSMFAENFWATLPKFGWRCSMRTWCYVLAQNALRKYAARPERRAERNVPLSFPNVLSRLVQNVRTETRPWLRTDVKDDFRELRGRLDDDDQLLLLLRIGRGLSFREVALTILGDADCEAATLAREEARVRQAFTRLKANFRRIAEEAGLLEPRQ